jgi:hypothetical protein
MIENYSLLFWSMGPGIFLILGLLVSLIPAFIFGGFTAFLLFIFDKISDKKIRAFIPVFISLSLGSLFIIADISMKPLLGSSDSDIYSLLFQVLESVVIIAVFDRVREKIVFQKKWPVLLVTGAVVVLCQILQMFFIRFPTPLLLTASYLLETVLISAATLGIFLFLKKTEKDTPRWNELGLAIVFCGLLFFDIFLFIGGLAVYLFTFLKDVRRPIIPILEFLAGATVITLSWVWYTSTHEKTGLVPVYTMLLLFLIFAFIEISLIVIIAAFFKNKQVSPFLVYGSILAGIIIELIALIDTPLISRDLFSFSSLITWFSSVCIAFGIIFCYFWIEEKRKTFQFQNLRDSQKILIGLAILTMITISLLLVYPIDLNPVSGKTWNRVVTDPPFGSRSQYSLVEWNDSLWIIGGNVKGGYQGSNETWFSRNGITWTVVAPHAAFEARYGHSSVVFDNKIWVIGGVSAQRNQSGIYSSTPKNDVWYSSDGITWEPATRSAEFPPSDPTRAVVFDNKIWIFTDSGTWNSGDGVNWSPVNSTFVIPMYGTNPIVTKDRMYVVSDGVFDRFWNSHDGITWYKGSTPPFLYENYSANPSANVIVINDTIWMFRSYRDHKSYEWGSDIWKSEDGAVWVLVTDSPAYAKNIENVIEFRPIIHNNKIWAFMTRTYHGMFTGKYSYKFEIWYSDL